MLKDLTSLVVNPINRPCREEVSKKKEDPIAKAFDPKLRRTNRAVGYIGVSWPDNKLYGSQLFDFMRELRELRKQQEWELRRSLRDLKHDLQQHALEEQRVGRRIERKNEAIRRAVQRARSAQRQAEEEGNRHARERSSSARSLRYSPARSRARSASLGPRSATRTSNQPPAKRSASLGSSKERLRTTLSPVWERPMTAMGLRRRGQSASKSIQRPSKTQTLAVRESHLTADKLRDNQRPISSHAHKFEEAMRRRNPDPVIVRGTRRVGSRLASGRTATTQADALYAAPDQWGLSKAAASLRSPNEKVSVEADIGGAAISRRVSSLKNTQSNPRTNRKAPRKRVQREASKSTSLIDSIFPKEIRPKKTKKVIKVVRKGPKTSIGKQSKVRGSTPRTSVPDAPSTKDASEKRKAKTASKPASESTKLSKAKSQPKAPKRALKTRMSKHHSADESNTDSTSRLVKDLDAMILKEKAKTWRKLQELSGVHVEEVRTSGSTKRSEIPSERASISSIKDDSVAIDQRSPKCHAPSAQETGKISAVVREEDEVMLSQSSENLDENILVPLYSRDTEDLMDLKRGYAGDIERNYFSDSSSSVSSFHFNGQGQIDVDVLKISSIKRCNYVYSA